MRSPRAADVQQGGAKDDPPRHKPQRSWRISFWKLRISFGGPRTDLASCKCRPCEPPPDERDERIENRRMAALGCHVVRSRARNGNTHNCADFPLPSGTSEAYPVTK